MHDATPSPLKPRQPSTLRQPRSQRTPLVAHGRVIKTHSALRREQLIAARELIEGLAKMREGIDVVCNALMPLFDVPGFDTVVELAVGEVIDALHAMDRRRARRSGRNQKGGR
jgi:hypothetical protein